MGPTFELARLVVNLVTETGKLQPTLDAVHRQLDKLQMLGRAPVIDKKEIERTTKALETLQESLKQSVSKMANMLGVSSSLTQALGPLTSGLSATAGATALLATAIVAVLAVLVAEIAFITMATSAFIKWNDEMIRSKSLLDALGKSAGEMDKVSEGAYQLAQSTRLSVGEARRLILENEKVAKSYKDAADWAKVAVMLAHRFAEPGTAPSAERIAEVNKSLQGALEMMRQPGGFAPAKMRLGRQLGPEMRAELLEAQNPDAVRKILEKFAGQGSTMAAADRETSGFKFEQVKKSFGQVIEEIGKMVGPAFVAILEVLADALRNIMDMVKELYRAAGVDNFRQLIEPLKKLLPYLFPIITAVYFGFVGLITVMGWVVGGVRMLTEVLGNLWQRIAAWIPGGTALLDRLKASIQSTGATGDGATGDRVNVPKIEGGGKPAEFSDLAGFWKKLQQGAINDPSIWARKQYDQQVQTNNKLDKIADKLDPKKPKLMAVAG